MIAWRRWATASAAAVWLWGAAGSAAAVERLLSEIRLPPGFTISVFAAVPGARSMALAVDRRTVFVGTRGSRLYAVRYGTGDPAAISVTTVSDDFNVANGVAYRDGHVYLAEQHRVIRFRPEAGAAARPHVLFDRLPDRAHHGWRYAAIGPDGKLYVTVGAPCNICSVAGLEGTIIRLGLGGGPAAIFARGVRNSVGIDFHPATGEAFFTDNGGDGMGDDSPPDELNHAPRAGLDFGYPYYAGGHDVSPDYRDLPKPRNVTFPVIAFGAHVAALGIHFYRGGMFPPGYRNDAFVAQHGSWNRSIPDGYRVMRIRFDPRGRAIGKEVFAAGWLRDGRAWGRPVDIKSLPDGSLLISDDRAGIIYRVTYRAS